jgi:hypothetical protein
MDDTMAPARKSGTDHVFRLGRRGLSPVFLVAVGVGDRRLPRRHPRAGPDQATFGFLYDKAGWDIPFSFLPYSSGDPYWWVFLVGLTNTIGTGAIAICTRNAGGLHARAWRGCRATTC